MRGSRLAAVVMVTGLLGCGEEDPPVPKSVFWVSLRPALGSQCSSAQVFELPAGASNVITSTSGSGERVSDGQDGALVQCSVVDTGDDTNFAINVRFSSGTVANFRASGTVSESGGGELDVTFRPTTAGNSLEAETCTAEVRRVLSGAVWIESLACTNFRDVRSPGLACDSSGGLIFENCDR